MQRRYVVVGVWAALLLVAAGLLFPVVGRGHEAAARLSCTHHLKCLALALHNYADTYPAERNGKPLVAFPAGTVPNADLPPEHRLSWYVPVLPFVEQEVVFKEFDVTRGPGDPRNEKPAGHRFQHLVCPLSGEYDRAARQWKSPDPLTHYVGVSGLGADAATLPLRHPRAGVFGYDRRTALQGGIPDGTANTLLLIETANNPKHWAYGGLATVRGFEPATAPYIGPGRSFGGFHNGAMVLRGERTHGCAAALADGSCRTFTSAIAPEVLEALATVDGREELPANW